MKRFLQLQSPAHRAADGVFYRLDESVDLPELATKLAEQAITGGAVEVVTAPSEVPRPLSIYVRPAAWAAWSLIEISEAEENDIAAAQQQRTGWLGKL